MKAAPKKGIWLEIEPDIHVLYGWARKDDYLIATLVRFPCCGGSSGPFWDWRVDRCDRPREAPGMGRHLVGWGVMLEQWIAGGGRIPTEELAKKAAEEAVRNIVAERRRA